jgi:alanine dehydrogenase
MDISITNEQSHFEMRVALTPPIVEGLVKKGNRVFIEKGAGEGSKFADQDFINAGAQLTYSKEEAMGRGELILMVSPVTAEECKLIKEGQIIMSFHHMAVQNKEIFDSLLKKKITTIGYEIIEESSGELPVLVSMSEIAGQLSILVSAHLLQNVNGGRGKLLGNCPGTTPPSVVILGAGMVGLSAARLAIGMGAQVMIIDNCIKNLRRADELLQKRAMTWMASRSRIDKACRFADVLIGAILITGGRAPHIISEKNVESMKKGAVIIDVAIDQGGCVETSRPTNLVQPTFEKHGVIHYCVPNMPAAVARTAAHSLANVTTAYIHKITQLGIKEALRSNHSLARGVYTYNGHCTKKIVADIFNKEFTQIDKLI